MIQQQLSQIFPSSWRPTTTATTTTTMRTKLSITNSSTLWLSYSYSQNLKGTRPEVFFFVQTNPDSIAIYFILPKYIYIDRLIELKTPTLKLIINCCFNKSTELPPFLFVFSQSTRAPPGTGPPDPPKPRRASPLAAVLVASSGGKFSTASQRIDSSRDDALEVSYGLFHVCFWLMEMFMLYHVISCYPLVN